MYKRQDYNNEILELLSLRVTADFQNKMKDGRISVEQIQDSAEHVLEETGYTDVAKAYILYRKQRERIRKDVYKRQPMETLEKAIELGCKTILTSGQQSDVVAGKDLLKDVYAAAAGRIDIMAGCGVKKWNIQEVHDHTGIVVFHTTGRKGALDSGMKYRKSTVCLLYTS